MAFKSTIGQLFARSPIRPIQMHMEKSYQAVVELNEFLEQAIANNWAQAERIQQKVSALEHEADALKMQVRLNLPKGIFLPAPRTDILNLLSMQELIINRAK